MTDEKSNTDALDALLERQAKAADEQRARDAERCAAAKQEAAERRERDAAKVDALEAMTSKLLELQNGGSEPQRAEDDEDDVPEWDASFEVMKVDKFIGEVLRSWPDDDGAMGLEMVLGAWIEHIKDRREAMKS